MHSTHLNRKVRRQAFQNVLKSKQVSESQWKCCQTAFDSQELIGRHVNRCHNDEIDAWEALLWKQRAQTDDNASVNDTDPLKKRRAPKGASDPITLHCDCDLTNSTVILFYRYKQIPDPQTFAQDHLELCGPLGLTGKVRIAAEGINGTLAGPKDAIETYINWVSTTPVLIDKQLNQCDSDHRYEFFKPSQGCRHVFADLSIKLVDEICPLGQSSVTLEAISARGKLSPEDFHQHLEQLADKKDVLLLDTRNYYESRIGHFKGAVLPPIRKFSRFPDYIDRNKQELEGKTIFTYCTGGIRCEKATAYMRQALSPDTQIFMLDGGIHNYLEWWRQRKSDNALWQGKNYVFDARQALGVDESIVGVCQKCNKAWDKYTKCFGQNCHLLVLCCDDCLESTGGAFCCNECREDKRGDDGVCECERLRRQDEMKPLVTAKEG
ncbi:Rhodanese-like domain-containing protein [Radiomyces spectabilis]|uniref:Rhodanese-like domain-containing protein n=1 Tax=Radiomyces spectabilis TaxID=64574 RepID=UPI00221EC5DF|nr:Rhodanese-like domain-containing protein [Radiomyces spectabilis]KAI8370515.1 Rhodanese-like domain-containing protein [Radiomyces spectabilis]